MQYSAYTTGEKLKKEIYRLLNKILEQKNDFQSRVTLGLSRDEIRSGNSILLGEFLEYIVRFFVHAGDESLEKLKTFPEFRYGLYEAQTRAFYDLEEKLSTLDQDLRELILAFWALKRGETTSGYQNFTDSLQTYCWDELNQLSVTVCPAKKKQSPPPVKKRRKKETIMI